MTDTHNVDKVIAFRDKRYGGFGNNARITQLLFKAVTQRADRFGVHSWALEAAHMICHKLSRTINGDPQYADNWIDIIGYAKLALEFTEKDFYMEPNIGEPTPFSNPYLPEAKVFSEWGMFWLKEECQEVQGVVYALFYQDLYMTYKNPVYWKEVIRYAEQALNNLEF
jgi:hypothetical protein